MGKTHTLGSFRVYWNRYLSSRVVGGAAAAIFGAMILVFSVWAVTSPVRVVPSEQTLPGEVIPAGPKAMAYYLPYPGLLPDSPVYKLKAVRDWARWQLTWGGAARAKLALLYADKRINAAVALFEGGKTRLALETAIKAGDYLQTAVEGTVEQVRAGKDEKSLLLTLERAVPKHGEILVDLSKKAGEEEKKMWDKEVELNNNLAALVSQGLIEAK